MSLEQVHYLLTVREYKNELYQSIWKFIDAGGMILLMILFNYITSHFHRGQQEMPGDQIRTARSERNPLLSQKDDNNSGSEDEYHEEDAQDEVEPNPVKDDEDSRRFCAICFEAPKDCFFVPCGHCVSCLGCANR